jgi:hypothetical protein
MDRKKAPAIAGRGKLSRVDRERGCFLFVQTLWAEKIQSTIGAGSLNTFGPNEIEVAPISSALLRIACLVILYKISRGEAVVG